MIRIFTSWFQHPDPERASEIEHAVALNASQFETWCVCPEANPRPQGTLWMPGPERPTFKELFQIANSLSKPGDILVVLNADISVGPSLALAGEKLADDEGWALTRWNMDSRGRYKPGTQADSQDTWVFLSPIREVDADFTMGVPGCDNRLAHELFKAGYKLSNPNQSVATFHHHRDEKRQYTGRVQPPYRSIRVSAIPGAPTPKAAPEDTPGPRFRHVLHVALITRESPQTALRNALKGVGSSYSEVDWMKHKGRVVDNVIEALQPDTDLVFMQLQSGEPINPAGAEKIRNFTGAKIVSWSGDVRSPLPGHFVDNGRFWDLTLMSNMTDVDLLRAEGVTADYLQIGYDPGIYYPTGPYNPNGPIVFMGNHYGKMFPLSQHRLEMCNRLLREFGPRFQLCGNNWNHVGKPCNDAMREAEIYRGAAIAIQQSHFLRPRYYSDRLLRAMACGPLVLTHAIPDLNLEFKAGEHLDVWTDLDSMVERIRHYLANPAEAARISRAGAEHAAKFHTWEARMNDLLKLL
jgi:hypothetical protein